MRKLPEAFAHLTETMPPVTQNAQTILEKRYLDRNDDGTLKEDVDGMYWRVASTLANNGYNYGLSDQSVEDSAIKYFNVMRGNLFLPNSPTLANAGTRTGQLSACFVLPIDDTLSNGKSGIYDTLTKAQLIFQTGGGVGYSFSRLRAASMLVNTTKGMSSGPLSFMDVYNVACGSIAQGGMRRGAQMGILRVDHPDILEFIDYKQDLSKLTNFNVSVGITDAFLDALKSGEEYQLIDPKYGPTGKMLDPRMVWDRVIKRAWATGEPGVVFLDRMNRYNPVPRLGNYEATNPCGEQPLVPYESCNLGSITLDRFVKQTDLGTPYIDWSELTHVVFAAVYLLDDVVDVNKYVPGVPEIREVTLQTRKLGLGIMGLARMLFKMGLAYDSDAGRELSEKVYAFIDAMSKLASQARARERGAYPYFKENWDESCGFHTRLFNERIEKLIESCRTSQDPDAFGISYEDIINIYQEVIRYLSTTGIRNSTTTTVAPTGTLSLIHGTSGGCEPEFALVISRFQADIEMHEANPVFAEELKNKGFSDEQIQLIFHAVGQHRGSLREALADPDSQIPVENLKTLQAMSEYYQVAGDIAPADHIRMQATLQRYCDSAISKTINFPKEATVEQVKEAYNLAIELGCKGVTIYRDGSRNSQPLTAGEKKAEVEAESYCESCGEKAAREATSQAMDEATNLVVTTASPEPRKRPVRLFGFTEITHTGDGKLYTTVNYDNLGIREIVAEVGRSGGTLNSLTEALGRMISLGLQYGVPIREVIKKLQGIRSANTYGFGPNQILSIPDAIARVLRNAPETVKSTLGMTVSTETLQASTFVRSDKPSVLAKMPAEENSRQRAIDLGEPPECPECGTPMKFESGCKGGTCTNETCGFAKC